MKSVMLFVLALLCAVVSFAQPPAILWERQVDYYCLVALSEGGYAAGINSGILILDEDFNELRTIATPYAVTDLSRTSDNGFIACYTAGTTAELMKIDGEGDVEWTVHYSMGYEGGSYKFPLELPNGHFLISGRFTGGGTVYEYDADGTFIQDFAQFYGLSDVQMTSQGILLAGSTGNVYNGTAYYKVRHMGFNRQPLAGGYSDNTSDQSYARTAIQLSNNMIASTGSHAWNNSLLVHRLSGGSPFLVHIYDPVVEVSWLHETADHCLIGTGRWGVQKLNADCDTLWTIPSGLDYGNDISFSDCVAANDGGILLLRDIELYTHRLTRIAPEVDLDVRPETQIVSPEGSTLHFNGLASNSLLEETSLDVWTTVYTPSGAVVSIANPSGVTCVPGEDLRFEDSLEIPESALPGEYMCRVHFGDFEHKIVMGADTFRFTKKSLASLTSDDDESSMTLPSTVSLDVYPNPFNEMATISVNLPEAADLRLALFDIQGREVAVLHDGPAAGTQTQFSMDASSFASGVYFVRAESAGQIQSSKLVLLH